MTESLKSEIEYVKSLAEAGDKAKFPYGWLLFWGGLAVAMLYLAPIFNNLPPFSYLGKFYGSPFVMGILQISSIIVFAIYAFISRKKLFAISESAAPNRAVHAVWLAIGLASIDLYLSLGFIACNNQLPLPMDANKAYSWGAYEALALMFIPTLLSLIGIAWFVTAQLVKNKYLTYLSLAIFICAPLTALIPFEKILLWLWTYLTEILLFIIVPAILFLRKPKEI